MSQVIKMPKLSDDMQEGTLVKWFKDVGDHVEEGELLFEIETDKANMEVECFYPGTLAAIEVQEGDTVPIGTVIARIAESEEDMETIRTEIAARAAEPVVEPAGVDEPEEEEGGAGAVRLVEPEEAQMTDGPSKESPKATPIARRMAEEHGVSLREIGGTGPRGRIIKEDVESYIQAGSPKIAVTVPARVLPLDQKRKYIVRKMVESKTTIPHYYLGAEVNTAELMALRKEYNSARGASLSITDFIVKACALALGTYPLVNAHFHEDAIEYKEHVNIAVAVDTGEILLAPVVKNCEMMTLMDISAELRGLVDKARGKKLKPEDYEGGTFYISNIGGFGIDDIAPIIFPTTSAILGVGAIKKKPVAEGDDVVIRAMMKIIISADHRVLDGARAAEFLMEVSGNLESPLRLMA